MKVICINADGDLDSDQFTEECEFELENGKEYTVVEAFVGGGYCWYVLAEDPETGTEEQGGFDSQRFSPYYETERHLKQVQSLLEPIKEMEQDVVRSNIFYRWLDHFLKYK